MTIKLQPTPTLLTHIKIIQLKKAPKFKLSPSQTMLIPLNDIIILYEKMIQELNVDYLSVVIYTGVDVDSLCTLKMLSKFFKSQSIQYKIYPVVTYTELEAKIEETKAYDTVRLFMLINCGGTIDLSQKWFTQVQNAKVFLFDVNKPIATQNIQCPNILIVDDENSEFENRITSNEMDKLRELEEFDLEGVQYEDSDEQSENKEGEGTKSPKRNSQKLITQKLRKHKELLTQKMNSYYDNTFFSLPSSYCLYRLIRDLNKANNYSLWFAIVGMTSMYLQNCISKDNLEVLTNFYRSDMVKFNPQNAQKREKGQIFTKRGYQFTLLNHWSLFDSMVNSNYLMTRLGLWNDKGLKKLHEILTTIGISLVESKQLFKYMQKESRQALENKIFLIGERYNLTEIAFESFMHQTDTSSAYMASDYHYLVTAVLEKPIHKSTLEELTDHRVECFWDAYTLLDGSQEMIRNAVEGYKEMSTFIMKEAKDIIERDNVIMMNTINFANIRCDTKEKRIFEHPVTLIRFSHLLMGIQKQRIQSNPNTKTKPKAKPFIVSLLDNQKGVCTIVGVSQQAKNNIGTSFYQAVQQLNIEVKHDRFMSNIIIIFKKNLHEFIKWLGTEAFV